MRRFALFLPGLALTLAAPHAVQAQSTTTFSSGSVDIYANGSHAPAAPYTANRKTTHVQKLADGTTITHVTAGKEARDSTGRTYSERRNEMPADGDESRVISNVHIFDPVARVNINWNSNSKEATVFHMPDPTRFMPMQPPPPAPGNITQMSSIRSSGTRPEVEKLGARTINGVQAEGTRITRVIPAGREGNDQPLTVINERWYSQELRLTVLQTTDDPRSGVTTMELTDIEPGEPDPSLFQVPEGYTVKDHTPEQPQ
ncbi:MAG: hypothetical protein ABR923_06970 [Terracidiphilus sp.]|jgi:hypothetical protein